MFQRRPSIRSTSAEGSEPRSTRWSTTRTLCRTMPSATEVTSSPRHCTAHVRTASNSVATGNLSSALTPTSWTWGTPSGSTRAWLKPVRLLLLLPRLPVLLLARLLLLLAVMSLNQSAVSVKLGLLKFTVQCGYTSRGSNEVWGRGLTFVDLAQ